MRRLLAIFLALALAAAACGDDSNDESSADTTDEETVSDDPASDDETDETPDDTSDAMSDDTTSDDTSNETADEQEIVLTDSYRGVTAETVTIGVANIDAEEVNRLFNVGLTELPVDDMYAAWSAVLNEAGGINGRSVEVVSATFLPVGGDDSTRLCLELMEDDEVFVVIGQFLQDNMLCITQTYGHPYVGHFGETPERQEASNGLFFAAEIAQVDQRVGGVRAMIDAGDFDGQAVAMMWQDPVDEVYANAVRPLLEEAGVNIVSEIEVGAATTDDIDNDAAWDISIERIRADGADMILNLSGIVGVLDAVGRAGNNNLRIAHTNGQAADGTAIVEETTAGDDVRENSFAVTTWKPNIEEALADPEVQRCIAEYQDAFPDNEADLESSDWVNGFTNQCRAFDLTVRILDAAGGDITPETFREAGESLGSFDLPAMADAFLSADVHSAGSLLSRYEYDVEAGQYVKVGEPISAN